MVAAGRGKRRRGRVYGEPEAVPVGVTPDLPRVQPRTEGGSAYDRGVVGAFVINLARRVSAPANQ